MLQYTKKTQNGTKEKKIEKEARPLSPTKTQNIATGSQDTPLLLIIQDLQNGQPKIPHCLGHQYHHGRSFWIYWL